MIISKRVQIPAKEKDVFDKKTCDLCAKETKDKDDWIDRGYSFCETEVRIESGERYPECGNCESVSFDICGECFKNKLIPFLELLGATPTVTEVDY